MKSFLWLGRVELVCLLMLPWVVVDAGAQPVFLNHHLHNFGGRDDHGFLKSYHCLQMGYYFTTMEVPDTPENAHIGVMKLTNADVAPFRLHENRETSELLITWSSFLERRQDDLHPLALMYGLERRVNQKYPVTRAEFDLIMGFAAAKKDISDLTPENVTFDILTDRFYTSWPLRNAKERSINLRANWKSRKVVQDWTAAFLKDFPWDKYNALFFDTFGSYRPGMEPLNADWGGEGHYESLLEGQGEWVRQVVDYARNPQLTGKAKPYMVCANIYTLKSEGKQMVLRWWADNVIRMDHYYFEMGNKQGRGEQGANGVVPGTTRPAYVFPGHPEWYVPADKAALDDYYPLRLDHPRQNRPFSDDVPPYDRARHFLDNLDAAGQAGVQGSWFGWYGEDNITMKDLDGNLIYTNDIQLLRALPNWDNMAGVPVPAYNAPSPEDQRRWDGRVYRSTNSVASPTVIYGRHGLTGELYVVFREPDGVVALRPGERLVSAVFVDDWFGRTEENALPALVQDGESVRLRPEFLSKLKTGIRITVQ